MGNKSTTEYNYKAVPTQEITTQEMCRKEVPTQEVTTQITPKVPANYRLYNGKYTGSLVNMNDFYFPEGEGVYTDDKITLSGTWKKGLIVSGTYTAHNITFTGEFTFSSSDPVQLKYLLEIIRTKHYKYDYPTKATGTMYDLRFNGECHVVHEVSKGKRIYSGKFRHGTFQNGTTTMENGVVITGPDYVGGASGIYTEKHPNGKCFTGYIQGGGRNGYFVGNVLCEYNGKTSLYAVAGRKFIFIKDVEKEELLHAL